MTERPTVLLAACAALPRGDGDDEILLDALRDAGCAADFVVWGQARAAEADLVILRCTWDYAARREEFLAWCESVPGLRNPAAVARWNTDKTYLLDLQAAGLPIVPTELVEPGGKATWPESDFVVKPTVGAGSRGAARFAASETAAAEEHLAGLHDSGHSALVQPYQATVDEHGETAVVFIAGEFSHAYVKGPMLSDTTKFDESGTFATESLSAVEAQPDVREFAERAMDAAAVALGLARSELLYARVDVVRGADGEPLLLELELTEPSLGFQFGGRPAADRMARAAQALLDA